MPSEYKRFVHQVNCQSAGKEAADGVLIPLSRAWRSCRLPPLLTSEVDIGQEKGEARGLLTGVGTNTQPQIWLLPHNVQRASFTIDKRGVRQQLKESLIEFVHQFKAGLALPLGRL
jgi:hypothetical protein